MEAFKLKLIGGVALGAVALAVFVPALQREVAIYQFKSAFPGLKAPSPPKGPRPWYAKVERVDEPLRGMAKVTVSVDNKSAAEGIDSVSVRCVGLDPQGKVLGTGIGFVTHVGPGDKGYGDLIVVLPQSHPHYDMKCKGDPTWAG